MFANAENDRSIITIMQSHYRTSGLSAKRRLMLTCIGWLIFSAWTVHAQPVLYPFDAMQRINPRIGRPFEIQRPFVEANGIRVLDGANLLLLIDSTDREDIQELPLVFQLAIPQWCELFSMDVSRAKDWKMRGYVIENDLRFRRAGLMPDTLPPFPAGYHTGPDMWVYAQPGDYYTRHLLLHEGTHAFMEWFLDGRGSPWYSEGMAEKISLHTWDKSNEATPRLKLNAKITDKLQVPYWGRVNLIHLDMEKGQGLSLDQVLNLPTHAFRDVRNYAWAWAACEFLSHHELSRDAFVKFQNHVAEGDAKFDAHVAEALEPHRPKLNRDWELFIREIDFGIEITKTMLVDAEQVTNNTEAKELGRFLIKSDQAWQATSIAVKRGESIRIRCDSRFQVGATKLDNQSLPWIATANGITLEYYRGRPLGVLLAGIADFNAPEANTQVEGLFHPVAVGEDGVLTADRDGILCLRINDSPAKMDDNQGVLEVGVGKVE
jgi:hypothetical protein